MPRGAAWIFRGADRSPQIRRRPQVPLVHLALLEYGWPQADCVKLVWTITILGWCGDLTRLNVPFVARNWPLRSIMRDHEAHQLTGGCFFSLGCALAIAAAPPDVSSCAIVFLVLGDMAAALVGVSFGGEVAHVKLGRAGKKSVEGSLAMFAICFVVGCVVFAKVPLREYRGRVEHLRLGETYFADGSRRRRGCHVDSPWRRVAATPRPPRG